MAKQFGLINPKAKLAKTNFFQKKNIFDDDSDEGAEESGPTTSKDWFKASMEAKAKRQTKLEMKKALDQDQTVYQYDEVYDDMKEKKASESVAQKTVDKKPKYIGNLLKHAEIRNFENQRRIERKVQKEREAEGDEFADKEVFVTAAYRKKMEEMQAMEEEEQKKEQMESLLDVTKQKDMSGFYRHIYRQTWGDEKGQKEGDKKPVEKEKKVVPEEEEDDDEERDDVPEETDEKAEKMERKQRSYRKQNDAKEESSAEEDASSEESAQEEGPRDKGPEEDGKSKAEKEQQRKEHMKEDREKRERRKRKIERGESSSDEEDEEEKNKLSGDKSKAAKVTKKDDDPVATPKKEKKPKRDIWKKITVGQALVDAQQRYLERKSERSGLPWVLAS